MALEETLKQFYVGLHQKAEEYTALGQDIIKLERQLAEARNKYTQLGTTIESAGMERDKIVQAELSMLSGKLEARDVLYRMLMGEDTAQQRVDQEIIATYTQARAEPIRKALESM